MYTVGMAYCGSGNNKAIRRLLHVAVSTSRLALLFIAGSFKPMITAVMMMMMMVYGNGDKSRCFDSSVGKYGG